MKRIQFILPVLFTMALGFVILSCDNKEVVTGGVPGGTEERYYDLDFVIGKKWCTTTTDSSDSEVKRVYYFDYNNKGVVCDWNDGNWEGYHFTYSLDTASNTINIESDTYSSERITLKVIQIKSETFFGPIKNGSSRTYGRLYTKIYFGAEDFRIHRCGKQLYQEQFTCTPKGAC